MHARAVGHRHFLVLKKGDEIMVEIQKYLLEHGIRGGTITGIGAADQVTLRYYSVPKKDYFSKEFKGEYEIASLLGNISLVDGKPSAHVHITIGGTDYKAYAGHLESARVGVTCEIVIDVTETEIHRTLDEETGLKVWNL